MTQQLAVLRALLRDDADQVRRGLTRNDPEPTGFLRFAHRHQLGAFVYFALQRLGLSPLLPRPVLVAAKASALRERTRIEALTALLLELADLSDAAGLDLLFIKGPLFSKRFYGDVAARGVADLDLLLHDSADLPRLDHLLRAQGFARVTHLPIGRRLTRLFAHHVEYRRDALPLDVHWVLQRHFTFDIDAQRIRDTAVRVRLGERDYPTTADEYELVLQALGVITDLQVGKLTLRPFVDIYQILRCLNGSFDWPSFFERRAEEKIRRPTIFALTLTLDVLACRDLFPDLAAQLAARRTSAPPTAPALAAVLHSRPLAWRHKLLALRTYETPLPAALAWWLLSLPFRLAIYGVTRPPLQLRK